MIMNDKQENVPNFTKLTNLAAEKMGAKALLTSDDFFAEKENLLKPGRGIFIADKYTERGKWMDGWESRRKRVEGHDWCIIQLGASGRIKGLDIDTNHFLGNHPPFASVEACCVHGDVSAEQLQSGETEWTEILPKSPLDPGSQHFFEIENETIWTHLKLHIYPDGGVARFKVYGDVYKNWETVDATEQLDLASVLNGARAVLCNDMFFSHMGNLLMPNRGANMGDGWETKRNRTPNNVDWVVIQLAHKGTVQKLLVDTCHFKGNYPDRCSIEGCVAANEQELEQANWVEVLPSAKLEADHEHFFEKEIVEQGPFTHMRLKIYPDGGVSRLRVLGNVVKDV